MRPLRGRRVRRVPVLVAIPLVLVGLAVVERVDDDEGDVAPAPSDQSAAPGAVSAVGDRALMPVATPAGTLTSTWFCAGGTASTDGMAEHTVVVANAAPEPVEAVITVYPGALDTDPNAAAVAEQPLVSERFDVEGTSRVEVPLTTIVELPFAAALVEVTGGDVVVEHAVRGPTGFDVAPCAAGASNTWYFAAGSTRRDARELLVLFNPFPDDAVVDLTFATPEGFRAPQPYDQLVVPGSGVVVLDISGVVARHDQVSTSIVARTGRLVADRIQMFDGSLSPPGLALTLGAPQPSGLWFFPDGPAGEGVTETYVVYNPSAEPAEVDLEVQLDDPATNGEVEPLALSVPPQGYSAVVLSDEDRIPDGVAHAVTVRALNGVDVVAERVLDSTEPRAREGLAYTMGAPLAATSWVLAAGSATDTVAELLSIQNPSSDTIARVDVVALAGARTPVDGLTSLEVAPAGRLTVDLGDHIRRGTLTVLVTATTPVVVERGLYLVGERGGAQTLGVPLAGSVTRLAPVPG